jgi:hypothetical protein
MKIKIKIPTSGSAKVSTGVVSSGNLQPSPSTAEQKPTLTPTPTPVPAPAPAPASQSFILISKNLEAIGALSVPIFLSTDAPVSEEIMSVITRSVPTKQTLSPPPVPLDLPKEENSISTTPSAPPRPPLKMQTVTRLQQTAQRAFGHTDGLRFEFIEKNGAGSMPSCCSLLEFFCVSMSSHYYLLFSHRACATAARF